MSYMASGSLALLSPAGDVAVAVSADSRLCIFDPARPGEPSRRFTEQAALISSYTVAAWAPAHGDAPPNQLALGRADGIIVVWDVERGEIIARLGAPAEPNALLGKRRRAVDVSLSHGSSAVSGIAWSSDGTRLISVCTIAPDVRVWDVGCSALVATHVAGKSGGCSAVCMSPDGATLFVGHGADVIVLDTATGARLHRLAGHSLPIKALTAASTPGMSSSDDASLLVSIADERNVCIWDSSDTANAHASLTAEVAAKHAPTSPSAVLLHPSMPVSVSALRVPGRKGMFHIAVVGDDGTAALWRYKRGSGGATRRKPAVPEAVVSVDLSELPRSVRARESATATTGSPSLSPSERHAILSLRLTVGNVVTADGGSGAPVPTLTAMVGPLTAPSFYAGVAYADERGRIDSAGVALRAVVGSSVVDSATQHENSGDGSEHEGDEGAAVNAAAAGRRAQQAAATRGDANSTGEHISVPKSAVVASGAVAIIAEEVANHASAEVDAGDDGDVGSADAPTLSDRMDAVLAALRGGSSAAAEKQAPAEADVALPVATTAAAALATTGSLATVLAQALAADDSAAIELVLGYTDRTVISITVRRLPASAVMPLLARLVALLQARPGRGATLAAWLRALLAAHAAFLLALPDLVDRLSGLYATLDARLGVHKKLLKLAGRMDLVLAAGSVQGSGVAVGTTGYARAIKRARRAVTQAALDAAVARAAMSVPHSGADGDGGDDDDDDAGALDEPTGDGADDDDAADLSDAHLDAEDSAEAEDSVEDTRSADEDRSAGDNDGDSDNE